MAAEHTPRHPSLPAGSDREEAEALRAILEHNIDLTPRQREALVATVMAHNYAPAKVQATAPSPGQILLQPGVVQAEALALNYAFVLGLDMSCSLQYAAVPAQAALLAVNYLMLTGLMMLLSLMCLVHAFVRWDLRDLNRAVLVAMGTTGAFGVLECTAFTVPFAYAQLVKLLLVVTVPLLSLLVAACSIIRAYTRPVPASTHPPDEESGW